MKTNIFVILVFVLVFLSGRCEAAREEAPDFLGKLNSKECEGTEYFYYIPKTASSKKKTALRTLVLVHGKDLIVDEFVARWSEVAEKRFVAIIAPVFEPNAFGDYGELNIKGPRADLRLLEIIKDANSIWPMKTDKFYIYGHSAGGEFAHRFAMVHPERIAKGAASCAGNYTFPEANVKYPYGVEATGDIKFDIDAFVGLNFGIIVGALDTDPNGLEGTETQGKDRVERAQNFYNAMKKHAKDNGIRSRLRFAKIPKAGHDFRGTISWSEKYFFGYKSTAGGKRSLVRGSIVSDEKKKAEAKKTEGKESSTGSKQRTGGVMTWMKCKKADCEAESQMGLIVFIKAIEKYQAEHPMTTVTPLLVCDKCGEDSLYRAEKCPKCDLVFKSGSMGGRDFPDRCPGCGFSPREAKRLERTKK